MVIGASKSTVVVVVVGSAPEWPPTRESMSTDNNIPLQRQDRTPPIVTLTLFGVPFTTAIASTWGVNYVPSYRVTPALRIFRDGRTEDEGTRSLLFPPATYYIYCSRSHRLSSLLKIASLYRETQTQDQIPTFIQTRRRRAIYGSFLSRAVTR